MDEENSQNSNEEEYEIYFAARERGEETEEEISFDSFSDRHHSRDSSESHEQATQMEIENQVSDERRISYNRNLPAHHSYLGNQFEELTGRVILEEESIVTIPLLCLPKVILIPGQILPLQFHGNYFLNTIKTIIEGNKIFGLVPNYINNTNNDSSLKNTYNNVKLDRLGTIVEVRSFGTENNGSILKIKAEGKERFLIKETWTESNRTWMGKVFILPEINIKHPFKQDLGLSSRGGSAFNRRLLAASTPYPSFAYELYNDEYLMDKIRGHLNQWASFSTNSKTDVTNQVQNRNVYENRTIQQATGTNQPAQTTITEQTVQRNSEANSRAATNDSSDVQPVSVNTTRTVVTRIVPVNDSDEEDEEDSEELGGFKAYAPVDPLQFSYWVLANLPLEDHQRLTLLSLNSSTQRLRWESSFFEKYLSLICIYCSALICKCEDIFSMSVNGYQEIFVNSVGIVHDTLTVAKVIEENISLQGGKCSTYSWFPNYGWIIMNCSNCHNHLGWKFVANTQKLNPQHFYGLSRRNLKPGIGNVDNSIENSNPYI